MAKERCCNAHSGQPWYSPACWDLLRMTRLMGGATAAVSAKFDRPRCRAVTRGERPQPDLAFRGPASRVPPAMREAMAKLAWLKRQSAGTGELVVACLTRCFGDPIVIAAGE